MKTDDPCLIYSNLTTKLTLKSNRLNYKQKIPYLKINSIQINFENTHNNNQKKC